MSTKHKEDIRDYIIHEDADYILINKPSGLPTLDDRDGTQVNIKQLAKAYHADAQVCHRLDKETSGILCIAKHPEAYRHMAIQFEDRQVKKIYHAVVNGCHEFKSEEVYLPILAMKNGIVRIDRAEGKEALTLFSTVQIFQKHTLVECFPVTGRMHQIRIHLSCLKAPIVCDPTYGGAFIYLSDLKKRFNLKKETEEQPLIKRVALHAYALQFTGLNGKLQAYKADYPKDFAVLVKQLEKYG
jgi:23S rRNA pseudouridine955/2504/2580 synthase